MGQLMRRGIPTFFILLFLLAGPVPAGNDFLETGNGARYRDLQTGTGPVAETGDVATMHFTGWLEEKVIAMLRALPKAVRRRIVPVPEHARRCLALLEPGRVPGHVIVDHQPAELKVDPLAGGVGLLLPAIVPPFRPPIS